LDEGFLVVWASGSLPLDNHPSDLLIGRGGSMR
jgi:hypothetical protein